MAVILKTVGGVVDLAPNTVKFEDESHRHVVPPGK